MNLTRAKGWKLLPLGKGNRERGYKYHYFVIKLQNYVILNYVKESLYQNQ